MLTRLEITNYRSIAEASVDLKPFTILVGANGSGKTNLLRLLSDLSATSPHVGLALTGHLAAPGAASRIYLRGEFGERRWSSGQSLPNRPSELGSVRIFSINPRRVGGQEKLTQLPEVFSDGQGAIQVLDSLKTGDREDLFDAIEQRLREFVPEIEKLSFLPGSEVKTLQVRERGIPVPVPVRELSEGTRLVLTILTIVYQERKPSIICLEDIDRGLHPALFGKVLEVCRALVQGEGAPQIIATTHNPYFVDQFVDDEESVVLVEKVDGKTTFASLKQRLEGLDSSADTLGGIWYSGLVGGVPVAPMKHLPRPGAPKGE